MRSSVNRVDLEAALRARRLDRTIIGPGTPPPLDSLIPVGLPTIDAWLQGGFPRGQLSEMVGARSSGRTTVLHALLATITARGDLAALVDSLDTFDPSSAAAAGVDLSRLLWVRGPAMSSLAQGSLPQTACERAVKAFNLILQAGGYGVMVLDLADMPAAVLRHLPITTWLRLGRSLEAHEGAGVLISDVHLARSARGVTLELAPTTLSTDNLSPPSPWQPPPFHLTAHRCQRAAAIS